MVTTFSENCSFKYKSFKASTTTLIGKLKPEYFASGTSRSDIQMFTVLNTSGYSWIFLYR